MNISERERDLHEPITTDRYCTAKFAVRGFTETLCQELKHTRIKVSCVHPGGIRTNIVRNSRFHKAADPSLQKEKMAELFERFLVHTSAEKAAEIIVSGMKKGKQRIMVGTGCACV